MVYKTILDSLKDDEFLRLITNNQISQTKNQISVLKTLQNKLFHNKKMNLTSDNTFFDNEVCNKNNQISNIIEKENFTEEHINYCKEKKDIAMERDMIIKQEISKDNQYSLYDNIEGVQINHISRLDAKMITKEQECNNGFIESFNDIITEGLRIENDNTGTNISYDEIPNIYRSLSLELSCEESKNMIHIELEEITYSNKKVTFNLENNVYFYIDDDVSIIEDNKISIQETLYTPRTKIHSLIRKNNNMLQDHNTDAVSHTKHELEPENIKDNDSNTKKGKFNLNENIICYLYDFNDTAKNIESADDIVEKDKKIISKNNVSDPEIVEISTEYYCSISKITTLDIIRPSIFSFFVDVNIHRMIYYNLKLQSGVLYNQSDLLKETKNSEYEHDILLETPDLIENLINDEMNLDENEKIDYKIQSINNSSESIVELENEGLINNITQQDNTENLQGIWGRFNSLMHRFTRRIYRLCVNV